MRRYVIPFVGSLFLLSETPAPARADDCNGNGVDDTLELAYGVAADCNGNGIPDACDILPATPGLRVRALLSGAGTTISADLDGDGDGDLVTLIRDNGPRRLVIQCCLDAADTNDDGDLELSDAIVILRDFFRPGTGIPAPGPFECGPDPVPDSLICGRYGVCE